MRSPKLLDWIVLNRALFSGLLVSAAVWNVPSIQIPILVILSQYVQFVMDYFSPGVSLQVWSCSVIKVQA